MMEQAKLEEKIGAGSIHCRVTLEIMGTPKEHVDKTMKLVMERLKEEKGVEILSSATHDAKEQESHKMFSTYSDIELLFKNFEVLTRICFDYMPSSFEMIGPESMKLSSLDVSNFVSDTLAALHDIDFKLKDKTATNLLLERNTANLLKNFILLALGSGGKTTSRLAEIIGIKAEQLEPFLAAFTQENLIRKSGDLWEKVV